MYTISSALIHHQEQTKSANQADRFFFLSYFWLCLCIKLTVYVNKQTLSQVYFELTLMAHAQWASLESNCREISGTPNIV